MILLEIQAQTNLISSRSWVDAAIDTCSMCTLGIKSVVVGDDEWILHQSIYTSVHTIVAAT